MWFVKTTFQESFNTLRKHNFLVVITKKISEQTMSYSGESPFLQLFQKSEEQYFRFLARKNPVLINCDEIGKEQTA